MELWTYIFAEKQSGRVGKVFRCISEGGGVFRAYFQAPEVDGVVLLTSEEDGEGGKSGDNIKINGASSPELRLGNKDDLGSCQNHHDLPFCDLEIVGFDGADLLGKEVHV